MNARQLILIQIMEECAEITQEASKALRFGMNEIREGETRSNAERIIAEFNDLVAVMEVCFQQPVKQLINSHQIAAKKDKIKKWAEHSKQQGILSKSSEIEIQVELVQCKCNGRGKLEIRTDTYPKNLPDSQYRTNWEYETIDCPFCSKSKDKDELKGTDVRDDWYGKA